MSADEPRKPLFYAFIILPILGLGGFGLIGALTRAYAAYSNTPPAAIPNRNGLLIALPAFFLWTPISLLLGNFVVYCIAPLRRRAEEYVARENSPGFAESQWLLAKIAAIFAAICVPLVLIGFVIFREAQLAGHRYLKCPLISDC